MSFTEKTKRFWTRRILRKVYDPEEIYNIPIGKMNFAEVKLFMGNLYSEIVDIQEKTEILVDYVAEIPSPCDKCNNFESPEDYCYKCEGTGVVKNKNLFNWPW